MKRLGAAIGLMASLAASVWGAEGWQDFAMVSMTDPVSPKLTNRSLCYTDGRSIACDNTATYVSTGGLINAGSLQTSSYVSAGTIHTSGTVKVSDTAYVDSLVVNGVAITGNGITGTGSATAVAYWSGASGLTYDSDGFYWDATNNRLGIGTSTPGNTLHVSGSAAIGGPASGTGYLFAAQGAPGYTGYYGLFLANGTRLGYLGYGNQSYGLPLVTDNATPITFLVSGTEAVRIAPGGNVGIGTNLPTATLQISGSVIVSVTGQTNNNPSFYVGANGYVGVGTSGPDSPLTVSGSATGGFIGTGAMTMTVKGGAAAGTWRGIDFRAQNSWPMGRIALEQTGAGSYLSLGTSNNYSVGVTNQALTIDPVGKVGISRTAPIAKLDVMGTISASDAIQVGQSALACATGISGSIRYNTASDTLQICTGGGWKSLTSSTTVGVTSLASLTNVSASSPLNNQILQYDTSISKWVAVSMSTAPFVCPGGFTMITRNNQVMGCMQNAENAATGQYAAADACYTNYGGRLPSFAEYRAARVEGFSLTTSNWLEDSSGGGGAGEQGGVIGTTGWISYDNSSASWKYRCFVPSVGIVSGSTAGVSAMASLTDVQLTNLGGRDYLRYDAGTSKWVNISESTVMSTTTMVPGWPDAIKCTDSGGSDFILYYSTQTAGLVYYAEPWAGSNTFYVTYTPAGAYSSQASRDYTSCRTSMSAIAAAGRTFNFIGSANISNSSALGDRITSGTLAMIANSATSYVSLSTNGTTWGYLNGTASYLPQLSAAQASATNISASVMHMPSLGYVKIGSTYLNGIENAFAHFGYNGYFNGSWQIPNAAYKSTLIQSNQHYIDLMATTSAGSSSFNSVLTAWGVGKVGINMVQGTTPTATLQVVGTISASDAIQVSGSSLTCSSAIKGAIRFSNISNTIEYCNSSAWASLGPSDTSPVAFSVHKNGTNQTVVASANTLLTWSTEEFDTNNNFASNRFTPTIPGKYLITLSVYCTGTTGGCQAILYKNGVQYRAGLTGVAGTQINPVTAIVSMNGSTDYLEGYGVNLGGTTINGAAVATYFNGVLLSPQGGSGGGSANPAGGVGDIQFNDGSNLAADTGQLFWDATNNRLGVATNSPSQALTVDGVARVRAPGASRYRSDFFINGVAGMNMNAYDDTGATFLPGVMGFSTLRLLTGTGAGSEALYANAAGNIGLGTLSPTATLQVSGSMIVSVTGQTSTPSLYVSTNGNIGLGTNNPIFRLQATGSVLLDGAAAGFSPILYLNDMAASTNVVINSSGASYFKGGNVGISTTTPLAKLDVNGTISASDAIQVSGSALTCSSAIKGAIRYSNTSSTIEYCNSTAWTSLGPSDTSPVSFLVTKNGTDQTVTSGVAATVTWPTEAFDSNNNFASNRFTPTVRGKYLLTTTLRCGDFGQAVSFTYCDVYINKNGATVAAGRFRTAISSATYDASAYATAVVDFNGTTDFAEVVALTDNAKLDGTAYYTAFSGSLLNGGSGSGSGGGSANPAGGAGDIQFNDGSNLAADTGQLFWDATNNRLGIGTNAPEQALDVIGFPQFRRYAADAGLLLRRANGTVGAPTVVALNDQLSNIASLGYDGAAYQSAAWITADVDGTPGASDMPGRLRFLTTSDGATLPVERMRISSAGNVGIGTPTPTATLQVSGTFTVSVTGQTTNPSLYVSSTGRVGIGTMAPGAPLDVRAASDGALALQVGSAAAPRFQFYGDAGVGVGARLNFDTGNGGALTTGSGSGASIRIAPGQVTSAYFDYWGNVGIGTVTPTAKLTVAGTISASDAIQVSGSALTCSSAIKGAMRYSNTSSTIEYCQGTAWVSMGPSATNVPSFFVHKNGTNQTVVSGNWAKMTWSTESFDTQNNFTSDKFTATVPGTYLVISSIFCTDATVLCATAIYKNGSTYAQKNEMGAQSFATATALVYMNGTTDFLESYGVNSGGTTINGTSAYTYFTGTLVASGNGVAGGGGGATPAGSTGDIQFNTSGALAADTGKLFWDATNNRLGIGAGSATNDLTIRQGADNQSAGGLAVMRSDGSSRSVFFQGGDDKGYLLNWGSGGFEFFTSATTQAMSIAGSGKVGVGLGIPGYQLDVSGTMRVTSGGSPLSAMILDNTSGGSSLADYIYFSKNGTEKWALGTDIGTAGTGNFFIHDYAAGATRLYIAPTTGNVGIGTTGPSAKLDVAGMARIQSGLEMGATGGIQGWNIYYDSGWKYRGGDTGYLWRNNGSTLTLQAAPTGLANGTVSTLTNALSIASDGKVGIGVASPVAKLDVGGNVSVTGGVSVTGTVQAESFLHPSDRRLKTDIKTIANAEAILEKLRGTHFRWRSSGAFSYGLIAQEVEELMPEAVEGTTSKTLDSDQVTPVLVEGWKIHQKSIQGFRAAIGTLVSTTEDLRAINDNLRAELKAANDNLRAELKAANDNNKKAIDALEQRFRKLEAGGARR